MLYIIILYNNEFWVWKTNNTQNNNGQYTCQLVYLYNYYMNIYINKTFEIFNCKKHIYLFLSWIVLVYLFNQRRHH